MKKDWLEKLQNTEFEILKEIDRVCKENNIQYFIMHGSLLGVIRHKGFIPWDDDIDIGMLRQDFNKFVKIANDKMKDKYKVDFFNTNKDYCLPFAKVRNVNTIFDEEIFKNYRGNKGIWVDIFPYDNFKYNHHTKLSKFKVKVENLLHAITLYRSADFPSSKKVRFLSKFINNRFAGFLMKLIAHGSSKYKYVVHYHVGGLVHSRIYKKDSIIPLKHDYFNGFVVPVPNIGEDILITNYGNNYMKLPPVKDRTTHYPLKIKFDDGEEIDFNSKNKKRKDK